MIDLPMPDTKDTLRRKILKSTPYNFMGATLVAVLLTAINFAPAGEQTSWWHNFVFSQVITHLCSILGHTVIYYFRPYKPPLLVGMMLMSIMAGAAAGIVISSWLLGIDLSSITGQLTFFTQIVLCSLIAGVVFSYFWFSRYRIMETEQQAHKERIRRLNTEKEAVEARLKMLQAQIEPHFLFNTLSNILSLLETDPAKGKSMLADLTQYLRASLSKSRQTNATLGDEMALIEGYLKLFKTRMGDRLRYRIQFPESLNRAPFPPMLIQPLVENAVKHGLEPKIEGGAIHISATKSDGRLSVGVADTGMGLLSGGGPGTGITNVKDRLKSLFGARGRLLFEPNNPTGTKATIEIPHE